MRMHGRSINKSLMSLGTFINNPLLVPKKNKWGSGCHNWMDWYKPVFINEPSPSEKQFCEVLDVVWDHYF